MHLESSVGHEKEAPQEAFTPDYHVEFLEDQLLRCFSTLTLLPILHVCGLLTGVLVLILCAQVMVTPLPSLQVV